VERPTELSVTVLVAGELDLHTAPRLRELLTQRLHGAVSAVTVDLSEVTFLGMAGVRVLCEAHLLAEQQAVELQIAIGGSRSARRALMACGADEKLSIRD
jgi:anti-anti-sigma factor